MYQEVTFEQSEQSLQAKEGVMRENFIGMEGSAIAKAVRLSVAAQSN
jgi:hypothetical protein